MDYTVAADGCFGVRGHDVGSEGGVDQMGSLSLSTSTARTASAKSFRSDDGQAAIERVAAIHPMAFEPQVHLTAGKHTMPVSAIAMLVVFETNLNFHGPKTEPLP
jgi:hypothetical protein